MGMPTCPSRCGSALCALANPAMHAQLRTHALQRTPHYSTISSVRASRRAAP